MVLLLLTIGFAIAWTKQKKKADEKEEGYNRWQQMMELYAQGTRVYGVITEPPSSKEIQPGIIGYKITAQFQVPGTRQTYIRSQTFLVDTQYIINPQVPDKGSKITALHVFDKDLFFMDRPW